jgi:uncharacterized protein YgiM (DUF1202 family)
MNRRRFIQHTLTGTGVAVLAVGGAVPLVRQAAASGPVQRVVQVERLNLRFDPSIDADVIAVLHWGDVVTLISDEVTAEGYTWVQVTVDATGDSGWVATEFIGEDAGGWGDATPGAERYVDTDVLNLRTGPGLDYSVVTGLPYGTLVVATGNSHVTGGYDWWEVDVEDRGLTGWVASELLASGAGTEPQEPPLDRVQVADGPLNVRAEPGLDREIVFTAPTGAYATVMDPDTVSADGYAWVYAQLDDNGVIGWMAMDFLTIIDVG